MLSNVMNKFGIILKAAAIVAVLLVIKFLLHRFGGEIIVSNPVITALVAGVIFTIAILFQGVLSDYKEAEKIPGELATSIRSLYNDVQMVQTKDEKTKNELRSHVKDLLQLVISNFKRNAWHLSEINPALNHIADDVSNLAKEGAAPPFVVKMRNELTNIDRLSNRIEIIMETSFIPVAYNIAIISTVAVLIVLLCVKMEHWYEGSLLMGAVSFILIGLLFLIKDMDNPFEYGGKTCADVDLRIIFKLEKELENR
jgi:predicted membrane chloride channel (bestrophin family)